MKKRILFAVIMSLMLIVGTLSACGGNGGGQPAGGGNGGASGPEFTIRFAGSVPEDHPITQGHFRFQQLVHEYTDGRIEVLLFPNGQMGSNREFYEQVQLGNLQMGEAGAVILANFTDRFLFAQLPFLFDSGAAVQHFLNSEMGTQLRRDIAEETNLYPLVFFENGFQNVTNSVREIRTPADMQGMVIRTQENATLLEIYATLGANPIPMAFAELFTAMQLGTVDGQVNPIMVAVHGNYNEVQQYMTDVYAVYDAVSIVINYDFYRSLPEDLREAVRRAAEDARDYHLQVNARESEAGYQTMVDRGMTVTRLTHADREPFRQAAAPVYDWFRAQGFEPRLDELLEAIAESNRLYQAGQLDPVTGRLR